jgi:integral membrane sensor domain MASE1
MNRQEELGESGDGLASALRKYASLDDARLGGMRHLSVIVAIAAIYFLAAKFGLSLAFGPKAISVVWPPTGIALAALLLCGNRVWPAITLGAFLVNLLTPDESIATAVTIAAGNTLEACLGAFLLRRVDFRSSLTRLRDVFALIGLAAVLSTAVSATVGAMALSGLLPDLHPWSQLPRNWFLWWVGDAMGNLLVAPVLLTLGTTAREWEWRGR